VSFHVGTIMWGLYFGVFHRDGRLFEIGNVIGHRTTHLEMGSRIVDRQPSNLNWTCVTFSDARAGLPAFKCRDITCQCSSQVSNMYLRGIDSLRSH
jgi:hypothetical protein